MRNFRSVLRGIRAMSKPFPDPKPGWAIRVGWRGFWGHWWTPIWHKGRGPYITIGLGLIQIYRGY